jgi:hypothetical protein
VSLGIVYWQKLPRVEVVAGTQHRHVEQWTVGWVTSCLSFMEHEM